MKTLPTEQPSITLFHHHEDDHVAASLERIRPHVLLVSVRHGDLGAAPTPTIAAARRRFPTGRLGIIALVSNVPAGAPLLSFGTGADEVLDEERTGPNVLASLIDGMAAQMEGTAGASIEAGDVRLVSGCREARIRGQRIRLPPTQFDMLWVLVSQSHRAVELSELVAGSDALTVKEIRRVGHLTVHRLRRALGDHAHLVETVVGHGYRLSPEAAGVLRAPRASQARTS